MVRIRENWTIEEDIAKWIRSNWELLDFRSASDFVNHIIKKEMESKGDIFSVLRENDMKLKSVEEDREKILAKIEKMLEEGNRKEREEAQKVIEKEKLIIDRVKERAKFCIERLKELGLYEEFKNAKYDNDLKEIAKKTIIQTNKEERPLSDAVGVLDMERIRDFFLKTE